MRTFLHILADALADDRCQALVIGGFSLEAYGFQRTTYDIDLLVGARHISSVETLLASHGYRETGRNAICARFIHDDFLLFPVDLLFINDATWDKIWPAAESAHLEGQALKVPAPAHAIALKLHAMSNDPQGRRNDFGDIIRILTNRPEALSRDELKSLCDRYAPAGLYDQILTAMRNEP